MGGKGGGGGGVGEKNKTDMLESWKVAKNLLSYCRLFYVCAFFSALVWHIHDSAFLCIENVMNREEYVE